MVTPPLKVPKDKHIRRALQQTSERDEINKKGEMEVGGVGPSNGAGV